MTTSIIRTKSIIIIKNLRISFSRAQTEVKHPIEVKVISPTNKMEDEDSSSSGEEELNNLMLDGDPEFQDYSPGIHIYMNHFYYRRPSTLDESSRLLF